jgi:hypothetical protein
MAQAASLATVAAMVPLASLPDDARVRVLTCDPALIGMPAESLVAALGKLFEQFIREDRCTEYAVAIEAAGRALTIAWRGPPLSGCSHDKISQLLASHEARSGCALLTAPPLLVEVAGRPQPMLRGELRRLYATGEITDASRTWEIRAETLGVWRAGAGKPLGVSSLTTMLL